MIICKNIYKKQNWFKQNTKRVNYSTVQFAFNWFMIHLSVLNARQQSLAEFALTSGKLKTKFISACNAMLKMLNLNLWIDLVYKFLIKFKCYVKISHVRNICKKWVMRNIWSTLKFVKFKNAASFVEPFYRLVKKVIILNNVQIVQSHADFAKSNYNSNF